MKKNKVIELRNKGLTFAEIGKQLDFSKQRAHQIFYNILPTSLTPEKRRLAYFRTKARRAAYNKEWVKRNRDKVLGYVNKWKAKNPDKVLQHRRNYFKNHREERLAYDFNRYRQNLEYQTYKKEWNKQRYITNNLEN